MTIEILKSKIHRATVTDANLDYVGSVSIGEAMREAAGLREYEKVDVLNINTGARFSTYVIAGETGEICLNGAAARLAQKGDKVIIVSYAAMTGEEADSFEPSIALVDEANRVTDVVS
ncbi:MAG: aspartate 1-decarboxylase [Spirochaetaceae bacterium]|nr:aspartate 1-decarboxylase [Spirochaetaceae bacterium]MDT8296932.1 aspartate 1-decarboxylase [Spirochaetaceae bacterium]